MRRFAIAIARSIDWWKPAMLSGAGGGSFAVFVFAARPR